MPADPSQTESPTLARDHRSQFATAFDATGWKQGWALAQEAPVCAVGVEQAREVGRHCPQLIDGEDAPLGLQQTFLWHDLETFGRRARFDQVAQFAAIRTDAALQPAAAPISVLCQPLPDCLPSPGACMIHGITARRCARNGLPEWMFAGLVAAALDTPGTTAIGYNNISFDAGFTGALRWRNLLPPASPAGRQLDLLDVLVAVRCLDPDILLWPLRPDGSVSFRLVDVCAANSIDAADAHEALVDVAGTLALGRLVQRANARLWSVLASRREPAAVAATVAAATQGGQWLVRFTSWADRAAGSAQVLLPIPAEAVGHRIAALDLGIKDAEFQEWLADPSSGHSPVTVIDASRAPMLFRVDREMLAWLQSAWGHDVAGYRDAARLADRLMPALVAAAEARLQAPRPSGPDPYGPDADPFDPGSPRAVSPAEAELLARWRALAGRPPGVDALPRLPEDPSLRRVVELFQARYLPQTLSPARAGLWQSRRNARITQMAEEYGYAHLAEGAGGAERSLIDDVLAHARALGWDPPPPASGTDAGPAQWGAGR